MMLHHRLSEVCEKEFSDILDGKPQIFYDGIKVKFLDGSELMVRYSSMKEYSFHWTGVEGEFRIDTAPIYRELDTFPNHIHERGDVTRDEVTSPDKDPEENLRRVIRYIAEKLEED